MQHIQVQSAGLLSGCSVFSQAWTSESVEEDWWEKKGRRTSVCDEDQLLHSAATEGRWRTNSQVKIVATSICCTVARYKLLICPSIRLEGISSVLYIGGLMKNSTGALLRWLSKEKVKPPNQKLGVNTCCRPLKRVGKWKVLTKAESSGGLTRTCTRVPREPVLESQTQFHTPLITRQMRWQPECWMQTERLVHRNCSSISTTTTLVGWRVNLQLWVQFILTTYSFWKPIPKSHSHWTGMLSLTWI